MRLHQISRGRPSEGDIQRHHIEAPSTRLLMGTMVERKLANPRALPNNFLTLVSR